MVMKPKSNGVSHEHQIVCRGCGAKLTYVKDYEGLPCNSYCCGRCCPHRNESPCIKERKFKEDVCEGLFALQHDTDQ